MSAPWMLKDGQEGEGVIAIGVVVIHMQKHRYYSMKKNESNPMIDVLIAPVMEYYNIALSIHSYLII